MLQLTREEKSEILSIARRAIESHLGGGKLAVPEAQSPVLKEPCGAFVTIKNGSRLRGCIGMTTASMPLYDTIVEMAVSAATRDPRFEPVSLDELPQVDLEISVLSPLSAIRDTAEITVGEHGLLIRRSPFQGLLLPQVAVEYDWNREQFLEHTCLKAGLPTNAWKEKDTEIQIFSAAVFGEKDA